MNSYSILKILSREHQTAKYFVGVFPSDKIPHIKTFPAALVINADKHTERGSHWLAIFIEDQETLEFFDSYGLPPDNYGEHVIRYVTRFSRVKWNKTCLQSLTSNVCGPFCIYFLIKRCKGLAMHCIVCNLAEKKNDFRMYQFVKKRYGVRMIFKK